MKKLSLFLTAILISACATTVQTSKVEKEYRERIFDTCVYMKKGKKINTARAMCTLSTRDYFNSVSSLFEKKKKTITNSCRNKNSSTIVKCMENAERKHWATYEMKYLGFSHK